MPSINTLAYLLYSTATASYSLPPVLTANEHDDDDDDDDKYIDTEVRIVYRLLCP